MKIKNIKDANNLCFLNEIRAVILIIFLICNIIYNMIWYYHFRIYRVQSFFYSLGSLGLFIFIFISGVESGISKNNIKRATVDIILGLSFLFIKIFFIKHIRLIFYDDRNIFLLNGIYIFIYCLIERVAKIFKFSKIFKFPIIGVFSILLFFILDIFKDFYSTEIKMLTYFRDPRLYVKCLILFFLFFAGSFFSIYFKQNRIPKFLSTIHNSIHINFFAKIGENFSILYFLFVFIVYFSLLILFFKRK